MNNLINKEEVLSLQPKPREDRYFKTQSLDDAYEYGWRDLQRCIEKLSSAQPERLTDLEQRIFLAAMGREEKVCKEVDREYPQYENNLVRICKEIRRKVKGTLWT